MYAGLFGLFRYLNLVFFKFDTNDDRFLTGPSVYSKLDRVPATVASTLGGTKKETVPIGAGTKAGGPGMLYTTVGAT